jgi:hypothetical protein
MSAEQTTNTSSEQPTDPEIKLTKKGKPRKPFQMTDARKAAFAKCQEARLTSLKAKKESKEQNTEGAETDIGVQG